MVERERLKDLLCDALEVKVGFDPEPYIEINYKEAVDFLLANGVIVPPCKIGDTIYSLKKNWSEKPDGHIYTGVVNEIEVAARNKKNETKRLVWATMEFDSPGVSTAHLFSNFGETVFLTREEAEAKLRIMEETT